MLLLLIFAALLRFLYTKLEFLRDVQVILRRVGIKRTIMNYARTNYTILDRFSDAVKTRPDKPFLLRGEETLSYRQADELSNKAARVLQEGGRLRQGETVALFLPNEPMFACLWLALAKLGCSAALLNCNIRSKSLLHCIGCSGAKTIIVAAELQGAVEEVLSALQEQQVRVFILSDVCNAPGVHSFSDKMSRASAEPLPVELRSQVTLKSVALYIYTSGTTGLPKAAFISHMKLWSMAMLFQTAGVSHKDVVYISLPLYHSAAFAGLTGAIERGITVALRSRFSASHFWDDCRKHNVTVVQYIGETMRYLCNTPKTSNDRKHKVRLAIGNGIRADVWREFLDRFGKIKIQEFYAATEGNFMLLNHAGKIGAVGRENFLQKMLTPYTLIKYDIDKGEPVRNSAGFCIKVPRGEPGLLVSEITLRTPFTGYAGDLQQTEKKRLHNVFKKGDTYFNSGDLLLIDKNNYIYFKDRIGDTFRWKGENVATTEVADVLSLAGCISEANVYGVEVPGHEGRVGMAAVILKDGQKFDSADVVKQLENLPAYARPYFLRIQASMDVTGTFKHLKKTLVDDGFAPNKVSDPLYFLDSKNKNYVPLTLDIFNGVMSGTIRI